MPVRIGVNGFGRIGRCLLKIALETDDVEVVAVNDLADPGDLAYLLKYDSTHGWYRGTVEVVDRVLTVGDLQVQMLGSVDPRELKWGDLGVDVVVESTGAFRTRERAAGHLDAGAKKVVISAPSEDADGMFVPGVNHEDYDPASMDVVSMASCTTNSLAPVAKVLCDSFGVEHLMFTTVHAYTGSQALIDTPTRKRRRGRSAALSIVPTSTGAAGAMAVVLPELAGRCAGMALRVPVPDGSMTDATFVVKGDATVEAVHAALDAAAAGPMAGVLRVSREELVSRDIFGDPHSSIVDAASTTVLDHRVVKVLAWYDNEWGYAARLIDFARYLVERGL